MAKVRGRGGGKNHITEPERNDPLESCGYVLPVFFFTPVRSEKTTISEKRYKLQIFRELFPKQMEVARF